MAVNTVVDIVLCFADMWNMCLFLFSLSLYLSVSVCLFICPFACLYSFLSLKHMNQSVSQSINQSLSVFKERNWRWGISDIWLNPAEFCVFIFFIFHERVCRIDKYLVKTWTRICCLLFPTHTVYMWDQKLSLCVIMSFICSIRYTWYISFP